MKLDKYTTRVVIDRVYPEIDGGRFPIKRVVGEKVVVEADVFADGHDSLFAILLYRKSTDPVWVEVPMTFLVNDRWRASFFVNECAPYRFTLMGMIDAFQTWRKDLKKRLDAGQDLSIELRIGADLIEDAAGRASPLDSPGLQEWAGSLRSGAVSEASKVEIALSEDLSLLMTRYINRDRAVVYPRELEVRVDRERARFGSWYEMFPRSCALVPGKHGTFADCERRLPYVSAMGFDVVYFPPIHPIGGTRRKGKNNVPFAADGDPGTPWAIGSKKGGHKAVNPELGTLEDFRNFMSRAADYDIEVALDLAFNCSPDHPYVKEHPEWFSWRPDGTIQYAENPPKKYEDIYPLNFDTPNWEALWEELKSVVMFWIEQGVRIFRVDNPHTKPFGFWEWLISGVKEDYPEVIFLSEAFTRPKIMYRLAKLGFTQSYTYFAWRVSKAEFIDYFTELTRTEVREFFRPSLWTNTPDILIHYLQTGGRPAFMIRLVLAATLGANYGIYGPAYELQVNQPRQAGSEEYLDSEKYEIKHWEIERPDSLKDFITQVNLARRQNAALQSDWSLRFHRIDNDQVLAYSKSTADLSNVVLVVVNLDTCHTQSGWVELPLAELGLPENEPYQVHDILNESHYTWKGSWNYIELNPRTYPAHIFRLPSRARPGEPVRNPGMRKQEAGEAAE